MCASVVFNVLILIFTRLDGLADAETWAAAGRGAAIGVIARGAVWRQNIDNRGRALGDPVLLLPRRSIGPQ